MQLRIWQGDCEFGKVVAKLARLFAKLAMRNFAKLLEVLCEKRSSQMYSVLWLANFAMLRTGCQQFAKFAMVANWLPTVCQFRKGCQLVAKISALLFFKICSKICTQATKINARKIA